VRRGIQLGTIDALLVALCLRHELTLLTADADFEHAATIVPLRIWAP
jgi:predicted nucleic acid-binding protein